MSEEIYAYWQHNGYMSVLLSSKYKLSYSWKKEQLQLQAFEPSKHVTCACGTFSNLDTVRCFDFSQMDWSELNDVRYMFQNDRDLEESDLSKMNMDKLIDVSFMFADCPNLKVVDLSNQSLEHVTDAKGLFYANRSLEYLDISNCENPSVLKGAFGYPLLNLKRVFVKNKKVKDFILIVAETKGFEIITVN